MLSQHSKQVAYATALGDAVALSVAFGVAFTVRRLVELPIVGATNDPVLSEHIWMLFLSVPLLWIIASQAGLYRPPLGTLRLRTLVRSCVGPMVFFGLLLGTAVFAFQAKTFSRAVFALYLLLAFVLVLGVRVLLKLRLARDGENFRRRVLIVGVNEAACEIGNRIRGNTNSPHTLIGHVLGLTESPGPHDDLPVLGSLDELKRIVEEEVVDEVVFAVPPEQLLSCGKQISWCEEVGKTVHLKLDFIRTLFAQTYVAQWEGMPILTVAPTPHDAVGLLVKRLVDVGVSAVGLTVLAPVMGVCALAIKLSSRGPILFRQKRVGLNGRRFDLYKFRSMCNDAEQRRGDLARLNEVAGPVFKIKRDPRVTAVGRWLRRFSLDELPQLWNVLRGDMSLVGPRPPVPNEVVEYERWQRRRLSMKPGLTCLWQISGRNEIPFEEWMRLDLDYIDNWSLKLDLIILLRTVPAVLLARGAH